jgi:hypothetical protein
MASVCARRALLIRGTTVLPFSPCGRGEEGRVSYADLASAPSIMATESASP